MKANSTVRWSLSACCRIHKVTIREISSYMGVTLKRIREVRGKLEHPEITAWEYSTAIKSIAQARRLAA